MGTTSSVESREPAAAAPWRLRIIFWLDVTLLLSVCALQDVPFTGIVIHEWLGLVMVGMVLAHLLFAWSWISSQSRRLLAAQSIRSRINYLLNLTLFACVVAVIFSGILISQRAVPALTGAKATSEMDWRWDRLHDQFSQAVLLLSGLHLAINWEWVLAAGEKVFRRFGKSSL
jgi:cytochrome b561